MREIWKYEIVADRPLVLHMPQGAIILAIKMQAGKPMMWAQVDPSSEKVPRTFMIIATGQPFDTARLCYIDTFVLDNDGLVFHVYELVTGHTTAKA